MLHSERLFGEITKGKQMVGIEIYVILFCFLALVLAWKYGKYQYNRKMSKHYDFKSDTTQLERHERMHSYSSEDGLGF